MKYIRLFMVLSSLSPLMLLMTLITPDLYFYGFCILLIIPNALLLWREKTVIRLKEKRELVIGKVKNRKYMMGLIFAIRGYHMFTIFPPEDVNPISGHSSFFVITKRTQLTPGEHLILYRFSNTVYVEI